MKPKVTEAKITDLVDDDLNANKGSERGNALMEKSFSKFGAGRSILLDKQNRIIAGNKSKNKFGELGGSKVVIIDADKDTLIAVRRKDIDLDTPEGREMAIADNATNKQNLVWDMEAVDVIAESVDVEEWGIEQEKENNPKDLSDDIETAFKVEVECTSEREQEKLYNELTEKGYSCRILTL